MTAALGNGQPAAGYAAAGHVGSAGAAAAAAAAAKPVQKGDLTKAMSMMAIGGNAQTDNLVENGLQADEKSEDQVVITIATVWKQVYDAAHVLSTFKPSEADPALTHRTAMQFQGALRDLSKTAAKKIVFEVPEGLNLVFKNLLEWTQGIVTPFSDDKEKVKYMHASMWSDYARTLMNGLEIMKDAQKK